MTGLDSPLRALTGLTLLLLACAMALGVAVRGAAAEPRRFALDPEHLSIAFLVDHIGFAKVLGQFREARGSFTFDEATGALGDIRIEIDAASVFTNHAKRDEHLRGSDFLNVREFPSLVFTASGASALPGRRFRIEGELELLGTRRPVTLEAAWNKSGKYPFGGNPYAMGVSARGSFLRSAFGMTYAVDNGWVGDEVELIIEFEARPD
jgi:polyisoprenoid-binding protein YceI